MKPKQDKNEKYEEKVRYRWFIIQTTDSNMYEYWTFLILFSAIMNAIWTPFALSFDFTVKIGGDATLPFYWADLVVNWLFGFDILIHFMASYIDQLDGVEVFSPKLIAYHYLQGEFTFDFISTVPF
jgi:hypothetical protein